MGSRLIARLRMLLVDTNIIAPLYVRSARSPAVAELFAHDSVWRTEPLALIELSNVLINYERARYITAATARDCLNRAAAFLQPHLFRVSHQAALDAALQYGTTAYDGRFLALAQRLRLRLVTEDARLRAAAPALTQSLAEAVAATGGSS
jgi:predicted nucleic acid-binding protein